ncbi:uracil-DNA glycosylase [Campylobacterota bacterium]|nr:uracil-DNA glycosylase [Campylobacterota bacterium]
MVAKASFARLRSKSHSGLSYEMSLEPSWQAHIGDELQKPYMHSLKVFLQGEIDRRVAIYPRPSLWFNAFALTPFESVKTVILGQDPYHGAGEAHGLAFSVQPNIAIPPSLSNIFKELETDVGFVQPANGCLEQWAAEGVLLLNSVLTVEKDRAASHRQKGWETFTDQAIATLSAQRTNLVFMLWGNFAQQKRTLIDGAKHLILTAPHPSPLSAYRGFFGCKHFSQANEYLAAHSIMPIKWQL